MNSSGTIECFGTFFNFSNEKDSSNQSELVGIVDSSSPLGGNYLELRTTSTPTSRLLTDRVNTNAEKDSRGKLF